MKTELICDSAYIGFLDVLPHENRKCA